MGIYQLNRYLKSVCKKSIHDINLYNLKGKIITVDASIYMYKYKGEQRLIEGMYQLISTLLYYDIVPVFIFDGAPPTEKKELLEKRQIQKQNAKKEYNSIIDSLKDQEKVEYSPSVQYQLNRLQKKFVRLSKQDYCNIYELIDHFGVTYYIAKREADELCAKLVIDGYAWACMSEDTDLFVYGCPRVLRYVSLLYLTAVLYNTSGILYELQMTQKEFREVCILSGTDYNYNEMKHTSLQKTLQYFNKYNRSKHMEMTKQNPEFYDWLIQNTNYITNYTKLMKTMKLFDVSNIQYENDVNFMNIKNKGICKNKLHAFLKTYNFIFIK